MRIRSIKPEFWRSDDIATLPISTRLTFIGLWSYVDDNGVGADKLVSIVADLYADDFSNDPQETLQRVSADLQRLVSGGQVTRYRADHNGSGKDLLYITKWKAHQKIQHPSLGHRYPLPPAELVKSQETLMSVSGESHEGLTHEQGNRGEGAEEQGEGEGADAPHPPQCSRHPNGNPNDDDCRGCKRVREWESANAERAAAEQAAAKLTIRQAIDNCDECDDFGRLADLSDCPRHPNFKAAS